MLRVAMIVMALSILAAAMAPVFASGTTTSEGTCKRGMVYDDTAKKCVKKPR